MREKNWKQNLRESVKVVNRVKYAAKNHYHQDQDTSDDVLDEMDVDCFEKFTKNTSKKGD